MYTQSTVGCGIDYSERFNLFSYEPRSQAVVLVVMIQKGAEISLAMQVQVVH